MYFKNKNVDNSAFVSKRISIADIMSVNILAKQCMWTYKLQMTLIWHFTKHCKKLMVASCDGYQKT